MRELEKNRYVLELLPLQENGAKNEEKYLKIFSWDVKKPNKYPNLDLADSRFALKIVWSGQEFSEIAPLLEFMTFLLIS